MPLPLSFPLGLLLGASLTWLARGELSRSELPLVLARPFLVALSLGAFVFGPVVGYFVARHGDWSYLYLISSTRIPSAVELVLVMIAAAQVPLGFAFAVPWASAKRGSPLLKTAAALGLVWVLIALLGFRRLSISASYTQYHAGFGVAPLGQTSLGRSLLFSWLVLVVAYAWCARVLRAPRLDP